MINNLPLKVFQEISVSTAAERYLLVYMIGVLLIICTLIILIFIFFNKRKNKLLLDKIEREQAFQEELTSTQIEIQEQTLKNIGQELHDNIGQLLSVANMQMSIMNTQVQEGIREQFTETKNVVKESLSEVRALSKSLNSDVIINKGFQKSVENEISRLNKLKLLSANLEIIGDETLFSNSKDSIILFRIIQEFISNTVKYASAASLFVRLEYQKESLLIKILDDGKGFDIASAEKGSGLINMKSRADLIHADLKLHSAIKQGTKLELQYPYREETMLTF
ncbi:two-component sensor histidine kinase [Bizionia argentinensis JUB59]|uniref:histidine kinase n=1 Tax=Bizionia argentinensis JUB59 TaxID=1046627 RepID=G2E9X4_9FLAO|nr:histidine kinase [Bizionia argentinensis]EGV45042.2 two-component sensor histidine kinase [Bizionia argentinensis JUB59]